MAKADPRPCPNGAEGQSLSAREAHGLWRSLREVSDSSIKEQRRLLAKLLGESSLVAIVEDAQDQRVTSKWLPAHIRSEIRTALSELRASESLQLAMQCPTVSRDYTTHDMLEVLDQDDLDDVRQLLCKAAQGGRQLWEWLNAAAEEEEPVGFFRESMLNMAVLALQRVGPGGSFGVQLNGPVPHEVPKFAMITT
ncbi:Uncharacterized protein SCF082_LOCUS13684 [Durusdinium trenchii]|uniref:Uncharacterized protein n=1 Tax=Durusdinium trenchii TaxID=1381693 RepID=A0ABP0JSW6_9DINO